MEDRKETMMIRTRGQGEKTGERKLKTGVAVKEGGQERGWKMGSSGL